MAPVAAPEDEVDHYAVLGLPSGDAGALLTLKDIEKAYRNESRKRHPDKRPDDPNATADFQVLTSSFHALRDPASRSALDSRLRARRDRALRDAHHSAKRRRSAADLDERERAAAAGSGADQADDVRSEEKRVAAEIQKELAAFQARNFSKPAASPFQVPGEVPGEGKTGGDGVAALEKERVLKVSWERDGGDYTAAKLRELFGRFGAVEDVLIRSKKRKGSALVVMASKESAVAATQSVGGSLSNPLLVLPLHVTASTSSTFPAKYSEPSDPKLNNIVGVGLQDYEASILKKLEKAQQKLNDMG